MTASTSRRAERLRDVSDTALWVAAYRAEESERRDALFHDPWARALAGERGFRLLDDMPKGRRLSWPMVARTVLFDRLLAERVAAGVDLVVNLAAGLDARPYRMELPAHLAWVEVDLPAVIAYKEPILAEAEPHCSLERLAVDLSDAGQRRDLLARLGDGSSRGLVLTEGLLIYLEPQQVATLAEDLAAVPALGEWITDLVSPGLRRWMGKTWGKEVANAAAPFRFAPEEGPTFFAHHGWHSVSAESTFREAARVRRLPLWLRLLAWLPEPRTWNPKRVWSGTCLLRRAS